MSKARLRSLLSACVAVVALGTGASAAVYTDATGEQFPSNFPHLDITSVEVTNTATDLTFKINLGGNIQDTNWGKYMIGIDSVAGGDTSTNGNGWTRPIRMSSGMDYWIGTWADGSPAGGGQVWKYNGATWDQTSGVSPTLAATSTTFTVPLSQLGLGIGSTFAFDVYSSGGGGGDSANDAAGNPSQSISDWPGPYNSGTNVLSFTVVPEPGSVGALGVLGAALLGRRRRR